jgi:hypothetical protein
MLIDIATCLPCSASAAIEQVNSPALLLYIAKPLVTFTAIEPTQLPHKWTDGKYWVSMRLFGVIPLGRQAVVISHPKANTFMLRDNGYSALIERWDHTITIAPAVGGALYRDQVIIQAGVLTLFVWLFAQLFYRHRQRRWRQLARTGFNYTKR